MNDLEKVIDLSNQIEELKKGYSTAYDTYTNAEGNFYRELKYALADTKDQIKKELAAKKMKPFNFTIPASDMTDLKIYFDELQKAIKKKEEFSKQIDALIVERYSIFQNRKAAFEDYPDRFFEHAQAYHSKFSKNANELIIRNNGKDWTIKNFRLIEPLDDVVKQISSLVEDFKRREEISKLEDQKKELENKIKALKKVH